MIARLLGLARGAVGTVTGAVLPGGLMGWLTLISIGGAILWALVLRTELSACHAEHAVHLAADARAEAQAQMQAREAEAVAAERMATIDQQLQQERARAEQTIADLRADLDAGRVRLRARFTCPAGSGLPSAAAGAGQRDDPAGLRAADAQFLVRLADECDARLRAAQAVIRADRGQAP